MQRFTDKSLVLALVLVGQATTSHAESNAINLHAGGGVYLHDSSGAGGFLGLDWQFRPGFAFDASLLAATESTIAPDGNDTAITAMAGLRFRFIDDYNGYLNEPHGNGWGNLYFAPRVGMLSFSGASTGTSLAFSTEIGYEFSIYKPVQIGTFFRWDVGVAGSATGGPFNAGTLALGGVSVSFGLGKPARTRKDQDRDGVEDLADACPDTPEGTEVDTRGCTVLHREMVLNGITFRLDSAEIESSSETTLKQAAQALKDNPKAEVEIGGHTDDTGSADHNLQLSTARAQSVANWLTTNGIPPSQLIVKGYGATVPKVANDSEPHRAQNRRIEFKRLDQLK